MTLGAGRDVPGLGHLQLGPTGGADQGAGAGDLPGVVADGLAGLSGPVLKLDAGLVGDAAEHLQHALLHLADVEAPPLAQVGAGVGQVGRGVLDVALHVFRHLGGLLAGQFAEFHHVVAGLVQQLAQGGEGLLFRLLHGGVGALEHLFIGVDQPVLGGFGFVGHGGHRLALGWGRLDGSEVAWWGGSGGSATMIVVVIGSLLQV